MTVTRRSQAYRALEGDGADAGARPVQALIIGAVLASAAAAILETVPALAGRHGGRFRVIEVAAVLVLTVEYALRLWIAPEREAGGAADRWGARLRYALSPLGLIDLAAILPFAVNLLQPMGVDWLLILRLARLFKLARYAPALSLFAAVIRNESRSLLSALMVMLVLLTLASGIMFVLEREAQPTVFASVPNAMWWAIVTIASVGYGDAVPVTAPGRIFAGLVMLLGIAMFAVPAGILATGFATEIRKRDFIVGWQSVARVPLFVGLDAARIAEIARLLRREVVPARYAIVRRGEPADAMFFIIAGDLEVEVQPPRRLGPGQYFGEIALLQDAVRTATVTALTECQLLTLAAADFRRLLDAHPDLRASVTEVARRRLAADAGAPSAAPPA